MDEQKQYNEQSELGPKIENLQTYSSDMADAVRENEMSVIKVALAEKAKQEREAAFKKAEGTPVQKIMLVLGGIILIVGGLATAYFLYIKHQAVVKPVVSTTPIVVSLISTDTQVYLDASQAHTASDVAAIIKAPLSTSLNPRSVQGIYLTQPGATVATELPLSGLLSILNLSAPGTFIRSLTDNYMLGSYQPADATQKPNLFVLLETKDYNQTYASMLAWEPTMLQDMAPIFGIDVSGDKSSLLSASFKDTLIDNNDARVLYDADGREILYYMFLNKTTFIIADNKETIREVSTRLRAKNTKAL